MMGTFIFISVNWLVVVAAFVFMFITTKDDTPRYRFVMRTLTVLCLLVATTAIITGVVS